MSSITTSSLARSVVGNPVIWSLLVLVVLAAGLALPSTPLLLASGALAFGRPLLHAVLLARMAARAAPVRHLPFEHRASALGAC